MKRRIVFAAMMALVMICITACGGGSKFAGTYKFDSMKSGETTIDLKTYAGMIGMSEDEAKEIMVLELKSDDSFTFKAQDDTTSGTWSADGNTITMTSNGESTTATMDGDTCTVDFDGELAILKKQ